MNFCFLGILTFVFSLLTTALVFFVFPKFGLMDNPEKYGHMRKAVPYSVGISFVILFVVFSLIYLPLNTELALLYGAILLLGVVSFVDDLKDLSPILRFGVQIICATIVVLAGVQVVEITNPSGGDNLQLLWFAPFLSILWIVLLTNLLNFLDGISGLTSGVSAIGFWVLFGLSIWPGMHAVDQSVVSFMALVLAIIATVLAVFEFPSPKFLIGDSGTMFFGFMLGVLTLLNGAKLATVSLVMLIPILDGIMVIIQRVIDGKKPWQGDFSHSHHRLLRRGFSKRTLLVLYYFFTFLFGLVALFAWNTFFKLISLLVLGTGFLILVNYLWTQEKK